MRGAWGELAASYRGTWLAHYDFQRERGGAFFSRRGGYFDDFPVMKYSHYATLRWSLRLRFSHAHPFCSRNAKGLKGTW